MSLFFTFIIIIVLLYDWTLTVHCTMLNSKQASGGLQCGSCAPNGRWVLLLLVPSCWGFSEGGHCTLQCYIVPLGTYSSQYIVYIVYIQYGAIQCCSVATILAREEHSAPNSALELKVALLCLLCILFCWAILNVLCCVLFPTMYILISLSSCALRCEIKIRGMSDQSYWCFWCFFVGLALHSKAVW